jgi:hypothetical protein
MNKNKLREMIIESLADNLTEVDPKVSQKVSTAMKLKPVENALGIIKDKMTEVPDQMKARILTKILKSVGVTDEKSFKTMRTRIQAALKKSEDEAGAEGAEIPTSLPTSENIERMIYEEMEALIR